MQPSPCFTMEMVCSGWCAVLVLRPIQHVSADHNTLFLIFWDHYMPSGKLKWGLLWLSFNNCLFFSYQKGQFLNCTANKENKMKRIYLSILKKCLKWHGYRLLQDRQHTGEKKCVFKNAEKKVKLGFCSSSCWRHRQSVLKSDSD